MISRGTITVLLCFAFLFSQADALNLTPHRILVGGDGPARVRHYFQDTGKRLGFRIDRKMTVNGSSDAAVFRFADCHSAIMRLMKSSVARPRPLFTPKGFKSYEAIARTFLPRAASKVQLVQQLPDAISINGWQSVQFVFTYEFFGLSYRRAITFLDFNPEEQYVMDVSARSVNFDNVYGRSYQVLNSLYELPADNKSGPS
jgi:hypothetical protein